MSTLFENKHRVEWWSGKLALSDVSAGLLVDFLDASVCTIKFLLRRTLPPVGDNSAVELVSFVLIRG